MKINVIVLMGMLLSLSLTSCSKDEVATGPNASDPCVLNPNIEKCQPLPDDDPSNPVLSPWTLVLPINGSGDDKVLLRHTAALRTMARTGAIGPLKNEIGGERNDILHTGHKSDINRIGFAPQLQVAHYIIAMYHPNNYPDHFIVYNINNKEWTRYEEGGSPVKWLEGTGD